MLRSELARELGIDPSVMTKRCKEYFHAAQVGDDGYILSDETIAHLRQASELIDSRSARTWPEAVRRVLGQYTDPVPPDTARAIVQRLDQLETKLDHVTGQVEWIASYLRERAEQQGRSRGAPQPALVTPPEQMREG